MACAENKEVLDQLMTLAEAPRVVAFSKALQKLDGVYLSRAANALRRNFVWLCYRRHENTEMHNLVMYNLISVYDGVARYLDCQGINSLVPLELFVTFSFQQASPYMAVENELFMEAGLNPDEVAHFWTSVDQNKNAMLNRFANNFRFQDAVLPTHVGYLGPKEGNSWISRLLEGAAGVVVAVGNVVVGTASTAATLGLAGPISAPLAVASVAAGVVAVGDACINASGLHN